MPGLTVTHLDHVSVLVTDVARSRAFYAGVLGLTEIPKPRTFDFVALWFDLGGGHTLHLLKKDAPDTESPRHFCLHVADAKVMTGLSKKPSESACTKCHNDKSPHYRGFVYAAMVGFSHPVKK